MWLIAAAIAVLLSVLADVNVDGLVAIRFSSHNSHDSHDILTFSLNDIQIGPDIAL